MKTAQQSAEKYVSRAGAATGDYTKGAAETTKDQAAAALAGEKNYEAAVTAAIGRKAFGAGIRKAGKQKWLNGVQSKGATRYAEGVSNGAQDYAAESARFDTARNAAANTPRGPKGSPANLERVRVVATALRAAKVGASA